MPHNRLCVLISGLTAIALSVIWVQPAEAQMPEIKEKPPMYSYIANWTIPRAQWADMEKQYALDRKIVSQAMADGTAVAYGFDEGLAHRADGGTHDEWWLSMSMAGLLKVLDQFQKPGSAPSPVLNSATKHWDIILVSRYYHWHPGTWKNGYAYVAFDKLRPDGPADAIDTISKNIIGPVLEKMLADGTIFEWKVDTEAIQTDPPGTFLIAALTATAEGLDKVRAALQESLKLHPLNPSKPGTGLLGTPQGPAFDSLVDMSAHREDLVRTSCTYK